MNWFISGLISYSSRIFLKGAIRSQGVALYDFINIQYLRNFDKEKLDLFSMNSSSLLCVNRWEANSPYRIKSLYAIHIIAGLLSDEFRKPLNFPDAWPDILDKSTFLDHLSELISNPKAFLKTWTKDTIIPSVEIEINVNLNKELRSLISCQVSYHFTNIRPIDTSLPATFVVFHNLGKVTQNVFLNFNSHPETIEFSELPKTRQLKSSQMKGLDGIYWISVGSKPRIPIVVYYRCPVQMLFNILTNYDASLLTQHDALISLNRILLTERDSGDYEIIRFLSNLLTSNKNRSFFSIKCHALIILGNAALASDLDGNQADAARREIVSYFFDYIVSKDTGNLQELDLIHPLLVLTTFQVISRLITLTENFVSFDFLKTAMEQLSSSEIGPGIVYCFKSLIQNSNEKQVASLIPHLIGFISNCSGNPPLMTAAIRVYSMIMGWYPKMVAEKIMISMIESFNDHQLPFKTRIAIADLLFVNFRYESFIGAFKGIRKEFESVVNPSFMFIKTVMELLSANYKLLSKSDSDLIKSNHNINEMYNVMHLIASHSADSFIELFSYTKYLFQSMFAMKWNKIQFPDGIIKATTINFDDEEIADGLFSDDE